MIFARWLGRSGLGRLPRSLCSVEAFVPSARGLPLRAQWVLAVAIRSLLFAAASVGRLTNASGSCRLMYVVYALGSRLSAVRSKGLSRLLFALRDWPPSYVGFMEAHNYT